MENLINIGTIVGTHHLRGSVKINSIFENIELIQNERVLLEKNDKKRLLVVKNVKRLNDKKAILDFEGIDNIDPTPPELALVVVAHRDIDGILVLDKLCCLLETFVFKVEPVFEHAILEIFRYIVKSSMDKYCPYDRHGHINPHIGFQDP